MIKYRKNEQWDTSTFEVSSNRDIDMKIREELNYIQRENSNNDIDVVDISIRSCISPETQYDTRTEKHYITIMYVIISKEDTKKDHDLSLF